MVVGPPIGALVGGVSAIILTQMIIDALKTKIFNGRKNIAVARAYSYLGINSGASDEEVLAAYHSCCLRYHPDRNEGSRESHEAFCKLQTYFDLIRCSRDKVF
uniref:J domain-containing protein n=1 Tax=Panagrolaimus superbus TaxID=310955 RepID=A0A914YL41_9BILA